MGLRSVAGRVYVRATGEDEAVQTAHERVQARVQLVLDREDDRAGAGIRERPHVGGRDQRGLRVPVPPGGLLVVGGEGDDGALARGRRHQSGVT